MIMMKYIATQEFNNLTARLVKQIRNKDRF